MISRYLLGPVGLSFFLVLGSNSRSFADDKDSIAEEYAELLRTHDAPVGAFVNDQQRATGAATAFLEFAKKYPNEGAAFEAIKWVATHILFQRESEALNLLREKYTDKPELAAVVQELDLYYGDPFEPVVRLLRHLSMSSSDRAVRGEACLALARKIRQTREKADRDAFMNYLFKKGERVPFAERSTITEDEWKRLGAERTHLLQVVMRDFGDIKSRKNTLAELASSELRSVVSGSKATDIAGDDLEGNRLRLNDARGKVVVLSFSANWCAPCVAGYPQLRELAASLKDRRFVLLGVNADPNKVTLEKSVSDGDITWRCWWDGADGPKCKQWNVYSFPTTFVLDREGVVRFKNPHGPLLSHAVEMLLDEMK
jgi:peroxiredoxin